MTQAYTPGLLVTPCLWWRCRRVLPVTGRVLVRLHQQVTAEEVVAETETPGDAIPVNLSRTLGVAPGRVASTLLVNVGDAVEAGQVIAQSEGLFGWFPKEYHSPITGMLESVSAITGQMIIRGTPRKVQVRAYLAGEVTEVLPDEGVTIEAHAAVLQGIFGIGGEAYGRIQFVCATPEEDLTADHLRPEHRGAIIIGGRRITRTAVDRARELGISALIAGGIDDQDLREILGYDLGVAVTGLEKLGLSVIITEGFGDIAMARRTFDLLRSLQGQPAAVNGTTQIRAGVLRPEIIVPVVATTAAHASREGISGLLDVGAPVRVIREPYFGELGEVTGLPSEPQWLASESKARVVAVRLNRGETVTVPRANVELMEGVAT
ncbi:hypothetical protein GC163_01870 [bacterium]|nr:hypothetical protein [bacterium]